MKKILSIFTLSVLIATTIAANSANALQYGIKPVAPKISESLKPMIAKYKKENYIGAMQDLEELVKKEPKNTYAKYYLALCYTRLGYKEEARIIYREIVDRDENLALSHYSQRALDCIENANSPLCNPQANIDTTTKEELSDMDIFIQSGRKIHPSAMDKITREKMEFKLQEEEYLRQQQEQEAQMQNLQSYKMPTNEEIATALNTLTKVGLNPYNQFNPISQAQQFDLMGQNLNSYGMYANNSNPEVLKMLMQAQMMQQQNSMLNYGI